MKNNEGENNNQKIKILKKSVIINSLNNKQLNPDKTFLISNLKLPNNSILKKNNKTQSSTNFLFHKIFKNINNHNNISNKFNFIKDLQGEDIDINSKMNYKNIYKNKFLINSIQLDKNNLRLISSRKINFYDNTKNNSDLSNNRHIGSKKNSLDVIKNRFLLSKINYYKRILNENCNLDKNDLNNIDFNLNDYKALNLLKINKNLFHKINNIKLRRNRDEKDLLYFPSIHNSFKDNLIKNSSSISIKNKITRNKDIYTNLKNEKSNNKTIRYNYLNEYINFNNDKKDNKKNEKNKCKEHLNLKNIINENYIEYLNDISSSSDSNNDNDEEKKKLLTPNNKNILNKFFSSKKKYKVINIKNGIFNLNKTNLNILSRNDKNVEEYNLNIFPSNRINSIYKINKTGIKIKSFSEKKII